MVAEWEADWTVADWEADWTEVDSVATDWEAADVYEEEEVYEEEKAGCASFSCPYCP